MRETKLQHDLRERERGGGPVKVIAKCDQNTSKHRSNAV